MKKENKTIKELFTKSFVNNETGAQINVIELFDGSLIIEQINDRQDGTADRFNIRLSFPTLLATHDIITKFITLKTTIERRQNDI